MRLARRLVPLLLASGCATVAYREPPSGPRARVRFSTATATPATVYGYERPGCEGTEEAWMRLRLGAGGEPKRLGMPLWDFDAGAAREVWVRTDRPLSGLFEAAMTGAAGGSFQCPVAFVVGLEDGGDYEVAYQQIPGSLCAVLVTRIAGTEGAWQRLAVKLFFARDTAGIPGCAERHPGLADAR
jgi:uncharacterized protein YceK